MKFRSVLVLRQKAKDLDEALDRALGAAEHILDSFNDDDSIEPGMQVIASGAAVVSRSVLEVLVEATEAARAEANASAQQCRDDGEDSGAQYMDRKSKEWTKALRVARLALKECR